MKFAMQQKPKIILSMIALLLVVIAWADISSIKTNATDEKRKITLSYIRGVTFDLGLDILKEAYKRAGISLTIKTLPLERCLISANNGTTDGEIVRAEGMGKLYPNLIMVQSALYNFDLVAYYKKGSKVKINKIEDLSAYKVGVPRGMKLGENATADMKVNLGEPDNLLKMLDVGRIDVYLSEKLDTTKRIAELKLKNIIATGPMIPSIKGYHYLNSKNADLVPKLKTILDKMKQDGTTKKIVDAFIKKIKASEK